MRNFSVAPSSILDGVRLHLLQRYVLPWEETFPDPSFLRGRKGFYLAIPSAGERFLGLEWSFQLSPRRIQDLRFWTGFLREHLQDVSPARIARAAAPSFRLFGSFTFFPSSSLAPRFGLPRLLWVEEGDNRWVMLYHWAQTADDVLEAGRLKECLERLVANASGNLAGMEAPLSEDPCAEAAPSPGSSWEETGWQSAAAIGHSEGDFPHEGDWSEFALLGIHPERGNGTIWQGESSAGSAVFSLRMAERRGASDSLSTPQSDVESEADAEGEIRVQVFPWPGFEAWQAQIGSLQEAMRRGEVRKVVLARTLRLISTRSWNAERAFQLLLRAFPHAYPFFFRFDDQSAFFGVTPERLARVENGILQTMALAGSLPRGATPEEDARLTQKLLQDERLRLEHQIVVEYIAQALQPLTRSLTLSDVQPLRLPNVQHLQVHIQGLLREGYDVLDAIQALHPTAALGGQPREAALQWIERLEPFERGWYGAPLGWVDSEGSGDFLVALRCGWVRGREALLFAGSGILPQSDARAEWEETALKFRPMLQALEGSLAVKAG
jgi:isochorismate synthase